MNTQLIADAANNSTAQNEPTIWDRIIAFWLRRLVYTQIWEDPVVDLAAMELAPDVRVNGVSPGAIAWPDRVDT